MGNSPNVQLHSQWCSLTIQLKDNGKRNDDVVFLIDSFGNERTDDSPNRPLSFPLPSTPLTHSPISFALSLQSTRRPQLDSFKTPQNNRTPRFDRSTFFSTLFKFEIDEQTTRLLLGVPITSIHLLDCYTPYVNLSISLLPRQERG